MSQIVIRYATARDAKAVADIQAAATRLVYEELQLEVATDAKGSADLVDYWRVAIKHLEPQVLVALVENKIVGFAGFDRSRDPGTPSTAGEVWSIFVAQRIQKKGVGQALWNAVSNALLEEGCNKATAWCRTSNPSALRFFEMAGFQREPTSVRTQPLHGIAVEEVRLQRTLSRESAGQPAGINTEATQA